jgi:hypothetical protein
MPEFSTTNAGGAMQWVERIPDEKQLRFRTAGQTEGTKLMPLYQIMDERYSVYWKVNQRST